MSQQQYGQVIGRAMADPEYRARLLMDPVSVLTEAGIAVPPGVELRAVEVAPNTRFLMVPADTDVAGYELTDPELSTFGVSDGGFVAGYTNSRACPTHNWVNQNGQWVCVPYNP